MVARPTRRRDALAARADGELAWTLGAGWLVGAFVLTLVMRGASLAGIPLGRLSIGLPLLLVIAAGVGLALVVAAGRRRSNAGASAILDMTRTAIGSGLPPLQRALWLALLAWIALRFGLLLVEATTRPLYPWDAWMQWATKARVWFELKAMVPFAPFDVWLPANGAVYFDAAPHYPATVPLWQVWSALLIGRWDDAHTNLAWWCTAVAIGLAGLRLPAQRRRQPLAGDRRRVARGLAADRQRARGARRLRRPADGRLLHAGGAGRLALGAAAPQPRTCCCSCFAWSRCRRSRTPARRGSCCCSRASPSPPGRAGGCGPPA